MAHQRYRVYRTSIEHGDARIDYEMAMAVRAGNRIWLRGQTGLDLEGRFVGYGDPAAQAENAMHCVDTLLSEAGGSLADIVKTTVYLVDREHRAPVYSVIARWLEGVQPCQTGLIVAGLAMPEMLMEIDVEAVVAE